jgi:hypothetical protein
MIDYQDEYQPPIEQPVSTVQLERYEYSVYLRRGKYYVKCRDTEKKSMEHGPMTREQADEMIESRTRRHEEMKRG